MPELVLIRGLPGSGKSTIAKQIHDEKHHIHYEADMWMTDENMEYKFDPTKLRACHELCQQSTKMALDSDYDVVVSNTFTQIWEMQPYLDMGYPTRVITATGNYENVHGVPQDKIEIMRERWEDFK